jgi:flagellar biosynthetic protein FliQ
VSQDTVVSLAVDAMALALKIGLPILLVGLVIGLIVSVFQAVTQIQEQSLQFVPKVLGLIVLIVVLGPWMLDQTIAYTRELYESIPALTGA